MTASVDVAARLDDGQSAVDTIAEYVWACHLLGFAHPDLTRHRYQVHDWYAAEDGLDLRALDTECAALTAAAAVADGALQLQDSHFQNLSRAWQGAGATASTDFLVRHAASSGQVSAGIRGAAATLARLRERLWQAVDAKVAAAMQIEGRRAGQRDTWLAAARAVSTGLGDLSAASELIDAQVKPFVINDIVGDWLTAMHRTTRDVADAYADAIASLRAEALPVFAIPGELGPARVLSTVPRAETVSATNLGWGGGNPEPAGFTAPPASAPSSPASAPAMSAPWPAGAGAPAAGLAPGPEPIAPAMAPVGPQTPVPAAPSGLGQGLGGLPGLGSGSSGLGGMPDIGSGLSGTGRQLADLFGGLLGSSPDGLPEDIDDLPADDIEGTDPVEDAEDDAEEDTEDNAEDEAESDETVEAEPPDSIEDVEVTEPQPVSPPSAEDVPTPVRPPGSEPPAEPLAAAAGETPCEIAADELPQAGP